MFIIVCEGKIIEVHKLLKGVNRETQQKRVCGTNPTIPTIPMSKAKKKK